MQYELIVVDSVPLRARFKFMRSFAGEMAVYAGWVSSVLVRDIADMQLLAGGRRPHSSGGRNLTRVAHAHARAHAHVHVPDLDLVIFSFSIMRYASGGVAASCGVVSKALLMLAAGRRLARLRHLCS